MNISKKALTIAILAGLAVSYQPIINSFSALNPISTAAAAEGYDDEAGHDEEAGNEGGAEEGGHDEAGVVKLSQAQMDTAGIVISKLALHKVAATFSAPGEILLNDYRTVKITPRIAAQITQRHAKLGDEVEQGQPLVTLSSVEMAQAQGELLVADREWRRVKSLGRKVVSEKRYTEARVSRDQARAKVHAYGMSHDEINALLSAKNKVAADGTFNLIATLKGRVLTDDFVIGERVEPGRELMVIADESVMWAEARVRPGDVMNISAGNPATVKSGDKKFPAKVSQIHHTLDETTRTLAVRLDVANEGDSLHPGMFINVQIQTNSITQALSVPEAAVLRSPDGDWQVLVEQDEPGEFKAVEIEVEYVSNGKAVISGIAAGKSVVTEGAFFVNSELAKSGFEIHNH